MASSNDTAAVTEQLQDLVLESEDVDNFLEELSRLSATILGGDSPVLCAVTLKRPRRTLTAASSTAEARVLDEVQLGFGKGPCLHAMEVDETVVVDDVRTDGRWPDYFNAVALHGYYAMLGVPLKLDGDSSAALNFYAKEPGAFDAKAIHIAVDHAVQASKALRLAIRVTQHLETTVDLKAAMESRTTIDLAVGIVMGQNRCSQQAAVDILIGASKNRNVKLRELAREIVERTGSETASTHFA